MQTIEDDLLRLKKVRNLLIFIFILHGYFFKLNLKYKKVNFFPQLSSIFTSKMLKIIFLYVCLKIEHKK